MIERRALKTTWKTRSFFISPGSTYFFSLTVKVVFTRWFAAYSPRRRCQSKQPPRRTANKHQPNHSDEKSAEFTSTLSSPDFERKLNEAKGHPNQAQEFVCESRLKNNIHVARHFFGLRWQTVDAAAGQCEFASSLFGPSDFFAHVLDSLHSLHSRNSHCLSHLLHSNTRHMAPFSGIRKICWKEVRKNRPHKPCLKMGVARSTPGCSQEWQDAYALWSQASYGWQFWAAFFPQPRQFGHGVGDVTWRLLMARRFCITVNEAWSVITM